MVIQQPGDTHTVKPCDTCGDVGFPEVIATCIKCKLAREHVYCMKVFLKMVPDNWICETCHSGNDTTSLKYVENKNFSRDPGDVSNITVHENTRSTSAHKMHNSDLQTCSRSQKVGGTGKVKFIPEEEAIQLCGGKVSSKSFPANSSMHKMNGQLKKVSAKVSSMVVKPNSSPSPVGHGKLPRHNGVQKTTITNQQAPHSLAKGRSFECDLRDHTSSFIRPANKEETSRENAFKGNGKELYSTKAASLAINIAVPVEILDQQVEAPKKKEPSAAIQAGKSSPVVDSSVFCANVDERDLAKLYHCCIPSSRAAWKGGFKFQSAAFCELYDGLEALPPCTVHRKAFYYSCKLPSVLEVEPLPISTFLIDLFQNDCPGLEDVALYFFPSDNCERSRQGLNLIFEFLDARNAMLRSVIEGVELLVFSSKQLNEESQGTIERLSSKNFLWGVFCLKKDGRAIEELTDTEAVDMDIDMVGGQDVLGRVDSVQNHKDKPGNFSINSGEGMILQKTSEKVKDKKILIASTNLNLNVRNKISLPTDLTKNIKAEFPFDKFPLKSVLDYHEIMDTKGAPPGFGGVHELKDWQPLSLKSKRTGHVQNTSEKVEDKRTLITSSDLNLKVQDKLSLCDDLRKKIKLEFPFDKFPLKSVQDYHKIMDRKDAPPGFEGVQELENLQPPSLK